MSDNKSDNKSRICYNGISQKRLDILKEHYEKPEIVLFPINNNVLSDKCSDMASCASLTMCYCVSVHSPSC